MPSLAYALWHAGWLAHFERNPAEVERLAWDLIELSTRHNLYASEQPTQQRGRVFDALSA